MENILVIGGGSWATAIVKLLSNNCASIHWWLRDEAQVRKIIESHHNPKYLSSVRINLAVVHPSSDLKSLVNKCTILIIATPSAFVADVFSNIDLHNKVIVSAIKGIIPQTNQVPATYFKEIKGVTDSNFAIISGPCHAEEVAQEKLSFLTIASKSTELSSKLIEALSCGYIRCTPSADVVGIEISAILKNIYALFAGICHGVGYGDNFMAVLTSNAIMEVERFAYQIDDSPRDVKASAYLGDLLVTAYSPHSRNRAFGNMIGKGYTVKEVQREMNMIAEGYYAADCIYKLNLELGADLPIASAVYNILYMENNVQMEIEKVVLTLA